MIRKRFSLNGVAALLLLSSACAPVVTLSSPDATLPAGFEARDAVSPSAPELSLDRWWTAFSDSQLDDLISTALARSTTARLAYARLAEARATRRAGHAATLPTGNLTASGTVQGSSREWGTGVAASAADSYQASFSPSWELDLFGRLSAIRQQADVDYSGSVLDYHGARLALAADVASALFQARGTAIDLGTARERLAISQDLVRIGRIGVQRGLTSGQDAASLESDVASARAEVMRLEAELQASERSLLILVGTPDAPTRSLVIAPMLDAAPALPEVTPGLLLARRPDVIAAGLAVQSQALGVQLSRLALFPRFNLSGSLGLAATTGAAGGGTGLWSLASGLALPILDRPQLMAQLRVSQARGEQAVVTYEQTVQQAFGEAENALTRLAANRARLADLVLAEAQSRRAYASAQRGYRAGLTDLTTLMQTQRTWLQARTARDAGRLAVLVGTVTAVRVLGGGWNARSELLLLENTQVQETQR